MFTLKFDHNNMCAEYFIAYWNLSHTKTNERVCKYALLLVVAYRRGVCGQGDVREDHVHKSSALYSAQCGGPSGRTGAERPPSHQSGVRASK